MKFTFYIVAVLILGSFAMAQDDEVVRVETNLVSIGVVVKDKTGKFIKGIEKKQFEVFDNKTRREVEFFSAEDAPVSYGIIYDLHPTTNERTKVILESIKTFTSKLSEKDDFFTVVFNESGSLNLDFVPTADQINTHLSNNDNPKPVSLYDMIYVATEKIRAKQNRKKTLIIISDGIDHNSHHTYATLRTQLQSFNVQIYSILLDDKEKWGFADITLKQKRRAVEFGNADLDRAAIEDLSNKSGGASRTPFLKNGLELVRIFDRIVSEMHQQYSIGFYPSVSDNEWHKIKVKIKPGDYKLSYRKGYQNTSKKK